MKKLLIITFTLLALTLAACGSASNGPQADPAQQNQSLPAAAQLIIGTFKLEGTDNAITAEQAVQLIPLWQVYKDLSASSSASQEEIAALIEQIQGTTTPEQSQAISDMDLTRESMFQTMQDLGIVSQQAGPNASGTPRPGGQGGGNFQGGGNGGPGGGPGGNNGQNFSPGQIATFQAGRAENGGARQFNRIPPALFDALIELLQSKK